MGGIGLVLLDGVAKRPVEHGRKLVLHLIRLNSVLAVSRMVTGKDYWVWGGVKTGNV